MPSASSTAESPLLGRKWPQERRNQRQRYHRTIQQKENEHEH